MSKRNRRAKRALGLVEALASGAQPYFEAGAYVRGVRLTIPRPEPLFWEQWGTHYVSHAITLEIPFDYKAKAKLGYTTDTAPATPWAPTQDRPYHYARPPAPGAWQLARIDARGCREFAYDAARKLRSYATHATACRYAAKLNTAETLAA